MNRKPTTARNQNPVSAPGDPNQSDSVQSCDCASAPKWMTELFDGDATQAWALAARAHLKSCAACRRVWREWSRTRTLLRAVPVPAAPSSLMKQVMLSCRLLPSHDTASQSALENQIAREELARYINAPEAEYSAAVGIAPLAGFFGDAPVPADMKARILQLTVQSPAQRSKTPVLLSVPQPTSLIPIWESLTGKASSWNMPRAGRLGFALAVPAMAAWMIMAAPTANLPTAPSATPSMTAARPLPYQSTFSLTDLLPKITAKIIGSKPVPKTKVIVAAKPVEISNTSTTLGEEPRFESPISADFDDNTRPQFKQVSTDPQPPLVPSIPPGPNVKSIKRSTSGTMNMVDDRPPSVRLASFSSNARSIAQRLLKRLPGNEIQPVSNVSNVEERPTGPVRIADAGVGGGIDFDETFASVGRLRDDRPAELGQAFDSYRASLLDQGDGDELTDEDLADQL